MLDTTCAQERAISTTAPVSLGMTVRKPSVYFHDFSSTYDYDVDNDYDSYDYLNQDPDYFPAEYSYEECMNMMITIIVKL